MNEQSEPTPLKITLSGGTTEERAAISAMLDRCLTDQDGINVSVEVKP